MATSDGPVTTVAVTCRLTLVAQATAAALAAEGVVTDVLPWPAGGTGGAGGTRGASGRRGRRSRPPAVAVLVSDLADADDVEEVREAVARVPARWVVLAAAPRGPLWGAALEVGAAAVLPAGSPVSGVRDVVARAGSGADPMPHDERKLLRHAWHAVLAEERRLVHLMRALTARERTVVGVLYAGDTLRRVAEQLGTTDAAVRSQARTVLRKLDVDSHLAAVAAYAAVRDGLD